LWHQPTANGGRGANEVDGVRGDSMWNGGVDERLAEQSSRLACVPAAPDRPNVRLDSMRLLAAIQPRTLLYFFGIKCAMATIGEFRCGMKDTVQKNMHMAQNRTNFWKRTSTVFQKVKF